MKKVEKNIWLRQAGYGYKRIARTLNITMEYSNRSDTNLLNRYKIKPVMIPVIPA